MAESKTEEESKKPDLVFGVRVGRTCGLVANINELVSSTAHVRGAEYGVFEKHIAAMAYVAQAVDCTRMLPVFKPETVFVQVVQFTIADDEFGAVVTFTRPSQKPDAALDTVGSFVVTKQKTEVDLAQELARRVTTFVKAVAKDKNKDKADDDAVSSVFMVSHRTIDQNTKTMQHESRQFIDNLELAQFHKKRNEEQMLHTKFGIELTDAMLELVNALEQTKSSLVSDDGVSTLYPFCALVVRALQIKEQLSV
jgi:hypothetical protein